MVTVTAGLRGLFTAMEDREASDLFVSEGKPPAIRVFGSVVELAEQPTTRQHLEEFIESALPARVREQFAARGDVDAGIGLDGKRFRINLSRQRGRLALVARRVPSGAMEFGELGLPIEVAQLADYQRGLILVTGATGSGKSTTLAAMVHHINRTRAAHVVTIEDPIEYVHEDLTGRVSQREVGGDTTSFHDALRHVVRQSPDVIVIGEVRDAETVEVALAAALTGHLVLASMHTIDATQTVQRMLSSFPEHRRAQVAIDLSLTLRGVVSQRLLPRANGTGRVLATELLSCGPAVSKLLRHQRVDEISDLIRATKSPDMVMFDASLLALYHAGRISYEVGLAHASSPDEFALEAQGMSSGAATFDRAVELERAADLDIKSLLRVALEFGASDLHLTTGRPPTLRRGGRLEPFGDRKLTDGDMRSLLHSILNARQRTIYELEQEIDFALDIGDGRRFRVNAYYQKGHMAAALRAIPSQIPNPAELRLPGQVMQLAEQPHGLILVVGPTGAGKSTTLACMVDRINRNRACRIITIEDPIEYSHESVEATVDQRELYADTQSFGAALKYILRQDPDVILVGEMRDLETVSAVLTAAETGHLVLTTLHSNDAVQAIDRIIDVFPGHQQGQARAQLAASLVGVVSQRLLPHRSGQGCVGAFEIMIANAPIRTLIRENKMHQALGTMETQGKQGMVTMDSSLANLYHQQLITYDAAARYLHDPRAITEQPGARRAAQARTATTTATTTTAPARRRRS